MAIIINFYSDKIIGELESNMNGSGYAMLFTPEPAVKLAHQKRKPILV